MELCFQAVFNVWRRLGRRTADSRSPQTAASRGILIDYEGVAKVSERNLHIPRFHIIFHPVCALSYHRFIRPPLTPPSRSLFFSFFLSLKKAHLSFIPLQTFLSRYIIIKACKPDDILHSAVQISPLSNLLYSRIFFSLDES